MGAGVLPFSIVDGEVNFLFQQTFSGRKAGYLVDFGGGISEGEDYRSTAVREFVEETEGMYFGNASALSNKTHQYIKAQIEYVDDLFESTLSLHPDWWRARISGNANVPKDWRTFFIEFPYKDIALLNRNWEEDVLGQYKKRRKLVWVPADSLLDIYERSEELLWKRVRQLNDASSLIREICCCYESSSI